MEAWKLQRDALRTYLSGISDITEMSRKFYGALTIVLALVCAALVTRKDGTAMYFMPMFGYVAAMFLEAGAERDRAKYLLSVLDRFGKAPQE